MIRTILLIQAMFLYLTPYAQTSADSLKLALAEINPDSSAIGKPIGDSVKKTIGPAGGKISSADGMMELTFPPGALSVTTEIGIEPVERTSVMSFGNAYACTPDGIHFQKPVQLVLRFTDSLAKGTQHAIRTIQWQDKTGRWSTIENVKSDTAARSISCNIGHFSTYTAADKFKIVPDWALVKVKQDRPFEVTINGTYPDGKQYKSGAEANAHFWPGHPVEWSVGGIAGGNDAVGHIRSFSADQMNKAIYTAPATVPADGVTITAKYIGTVAMGKDSVEKDPISVAVVDIYDEFHYSFIGYDHVGHLFMIDSATCDIQVFSSGVARISNIRNPTPWSDWPAKVGKCSYEYPDKTGWKGMVQISGINSGNFQRIPGGTSYHPTATTKVLISLTSTMGSSPSYKEHCPGHDKTVPSFPVSAQPVVIHFEIFPDKPDILITYGADNSMNSLVRMRGNQGFSIAVSHK